MLSHLVQRKGSNITIRLHDKSTAKQIRMVIGQEASLLQEGLLLRVSL